MSGKLEAYDDNKLTSKSGVEKGRPTNISITKPRKSKKNFKGGILSEDLKWRIYKSDVEPQLTNRVLQDEPNSEMLATIKHALNEYKISDIGKIIKDVKKEPDENISNEIITPAHIDTSVRERLANAAENRIKTKEATDKLAGVFKRKQIQSLVQQGYDDAERRDAAGTLSHYAGHKLLQNYMNDDFLKGKTFGEKRKEIEDAEMEKNFLNNPINNGQKFAHQMKFSDALNDIKKAPKLKKSQTVSLNNDIANLMKQSLNKQKSVIYTEVAGHKSKPTETVGTQTNLGSGIKGSPTTAERLTRLANTITPNPRSINRAPLNTQVYHPTTPENRRFSSYYGFSPNPYLNRPNTVSHPARRVYPASTPPSKLTPKFSKL